MERVILANDRDRRTLAWLRRVRGDDAVKQAIDAVAASGSRVYVSNVVKRMGMAEAAKTAGLDREPRTPEQLAEIQAQKEAREAEQRKRTAAFLKAKREEWGAARTPVQAAAPAAPALESMSPSKPSIKERVAQLEAQARAQAQDKYGDTQVSE